MYHCHVHFYFIGHQQRLFELFTQMPPLGRFCHTFSSGNQPEPDQTAQADVILADLQGTDVQAALAALTAGKKPDAQIILLADQAQAALLGDGLAQLHDLWTLPMSDEEARFRFLRWQQSFRRDKDLWMTNQYLETTINSVPNLIWYKDRDGIHRKVNDSFCRTVSKTKEQVVGRGHAYIWDVEEDDPVCIESEQEVMRRRETCVAEESVQTGGEIRLLTTYKSPLYDLDGSVAGTVGVGIDITQERAYEREIVRKNQTLEDPFTSLDCGIMRHTVDGYIISVNQAALTILGYDSREALEQDGFQMIAPTVAEEDREQLLRSIATLQDVGDSVSVEYRVRRKDGTLLHIMGNVKLMEEDGRQFYQRFLLDCTAQKQREAEERTQLELRQAELVQALSIDYSLVCVFDLADGTGSTLRISECEFGVLSSIFSEPLSMETCMESYISTCVHPDDQEAMRHACSAGFLKEELKRHGHYYINYRTICGGKPRYFQMKAVFTRFGASGCGAVTGFRSVDEETRQEMEKKHILEDALFQANRANSAKSVFLSNMSHDIRTPMNAIVGFTALALTHIDRREQVEEYLKKIMTSGNHLLSLINDILDMSRIESGKMHLDEKPCSLPDILHSLRSIVQADIHAKQLELYIDAVDVQDEEIICDKLRLNQVLLNLLSNAIKYTGAGGIVTMRITEKPGAPSGYGNYEFTIKDTGIGMSPEFVSRIFEPFERERNSTISGIQGTGLGMAITKNIVNMMNGSIQVQSEQGVGTEFTVSFTFQLHAGPQPPLVIPALKNCRALVVDDDFNTCDSVSYMLQQIGMRAEWTLSGKEAVLRTRQAVMRNDNYCVYIVDWLLPDMNGVEVVRRIRKETGETGETVPIIVLTAYDWSDIEEEAREAGVTAFCSKPLFLSELRSCLNTVAGADENTPEETKESATALHSGRILLAEDNELNQEIATAILEEAGFTAEIAANGQIALDMLARSEPGYYKLVLMDIQMPVMDGYETTRRIRALENRTLASIPILAMTANAFEEDKRQAISCGMNGHIAKPIDMDRLIHIVDEMLS